MGSHPIFFSLILIFMALLVGILIISLSTSWFFYLLVLVFLGGVIILIIYISTLAANEKFVRPDFPSLLLFIVAGIFRRFMLSSYNYTNKSSYNIRMLINLYEYSNGSLSIFLIVYLLITIVCVVKLVKFERGPLVGRL